MLVWFGKGEVLWCLLVVISGDIVVFIDLDLINLYFLFVLWLVGLLFIGEGI